MKKAFFCLLLSCLASFPITGYPQKSYLAINSVHLPKTIADNNIQMSLQDQAGLLWFVTENGLYRYDGSELLHFGIGTTPALPSLAITALCTDQRGNLWIGFNNGVARFDLKSWTISPLFSSDWKSLSSHEKKITAIACLKDGSVYFGTKSGKLFVQQQNKLVLVTDLGVGRKSFKPTGPPVQEASIDNIQEPIKGQLWITTSDGMLVSIQKSNHRYQKPVLHKFAVSSDMSIANICYDSSGKCIFSVETKGFFVSDIKALLKEKNSGIDSSLNHGFSSIITAAPLPDSLQPNNIPLCFYIPGGQIGIISTDNRLSRYVYIYDFSTNQWRRNAQSYIARYPGELIHSISALASSKITYINAAGGLTAIQAGFLPFDMPLSSEDNINSIRAIYADGDDLYIASYQQYLLKFNKTTGKITPLQTIYVYSILPWSRDTLLIGSEGGGLCWFVPSINKLTYIGAKFDLTRQASVYQSKFITVLQRVNPYQLLEGTTRGIHLVDPINKKLYPIFSNPSAQNMQASKINAITPYPLKSFSTPSTYLVGTDAGAFIINTQNGHSAYLLAATTAEEIRQSSVHCFVTVNQQIWMGTSGLGILAVDAKGKLHFMEWLNALLSGHTIYSMIRSGSHILIGTNKGLNILDLKDSSVVNYQASDGMHSDEFNQAASFKDADEVYLGTLNGIIWWNHQKESIHKRPLGFSVHINKFTVADNRNHIKTIYHLAYLPSGSSHIDIPPNTRYFSITFDNPGEQDKNTPYYYRLGPKETWVNIGSRREITFNKLPPGDYQFQLTRNISAKNMQAASFQIPITIHPAYYQTIWFKLMILLITAALLYFILRLRQNQLNKERNLRTKIAGDLHDEIGSSLTRIWHQAQRLQPAALTSISSTSSISPESKTGEDKRLQHIAATSQEAMSMLSDMVWSIDAQFDTLDELLLRMKTYVYQLQNDFDIAIKMTTTNISKEKKLSQIIRQNLFLLFKEAINNAIKYGNGTLINITTEIDTKIKIEVTNAFTQELKNNTAMGGRGIANMQRRVKNMNGELKFHKDKNIFTLTILV